MSRVEMYASRLCSLILRDERVYIAGAERGAVNERICCRAMCVYACLFC